MEIREYLQVLVRWIWLLALGSVLSAVMGYYFLRSTMPWPPYDASTTFMIVGDFQSAEMVQLVAGTYAEFARQETVTQAVAKSLEFSVTADELEDIVRVSPVGATPLLRISVTYSDPQQAADIANEFARQLGRISLSGEVLPENAPSTIIFMTMATAPGGPSSSGYVRILIAALMGLTLSAGIAILIDYFDESVRTSEEVKAFLNLPVLATIPRFGRRRDGYPKRLIAYHQPLSSVSEYFRKLGTNLLLFEKGISSSVFIVTSPGPREGKSIVAANTAVTIAATGLRVLLIDADLHRPRVHQILELENKIGLTELILSRLIRSERTNGKTSVRDVAQLAGVSTTTVYRVLHEKNEVASETRKRVRDAIAITNLDPGYYAPRPSAEEYSEDRFGSILEKYVHTTDIPNLQVISAGSPPSNPAKLLDSSLLDNLFRTLVAMGEFDVILVDAPPCLIVADTSILAAKSKAVVTLVIEAGRTKRGAMLKSKEQFENIGNEISGIVLNKADTSRETYGYDPDTYLADIKGKGFIKSLKKRGS